MNHIEAARQWLSYKQVHQDAALLFNKMIEISPGPLVLIAVARGGWLPTRLIGALCDEAGVDNSTLSLSVNYERLGSPTEQARVSQGFDQLAIATLISCAKAGAGLWLVDGPYAMGGVAVVAHNYVEGVLHENAVPHVRVRIGVLHWVTFARCSPAPWRSSSSRSPDAFARHISIEEKPYIDYPWEHSAGEDGKGV